MMIEVDVRGFVCPIPVLRTKQAMEKNEGDEIRVVVDSAAAKENVSRLASSKSYSIKLEEEEGDYYLILSPSVKQL
ncbi:MAG: sulfurtransferase TusA family protein [Dehalococcoidia bacterium]|nr:MAG: sulfurtransferase TusA family protein [Dehalococcoidia bacterium]